VRTVPIFVTESPIVTLISDVHSSNAACERAIVHTSSELADARKCVCETCANKAERTRVCQASNHLGITGSTSPPSRASMACVSM
jgi:hypothetical protein